MKTYRIQVHFSHAAVRVIKSYDVSSLNEDIAIFEAGIEFCADLLLASKGGLEIRPKEIIFHRIDLVEK